MRCHSVMSDPVTPWTVARQAPPSMGFSRQEYWSGLSFSSLVFLEYISPFNICYKTGLAVLNFLNFCLSEKLFISPSILNEILAGYSNLGVDFSRSVL